MQQPYVSIWGHKDQQNVVHLFKEPTAWKQGVRGAGGGGRHVLGNTHDNISSTPTVRDVGREGEQRPLASSWVSYSWAQEGSKDS